MDLSDIGMQKNRFAVSAAVVHGVSACDEDRRRTYSATTFGQLNNGEIFTLAGIHMGKVRPRRDNDLYRWEHNQNRPHLNSIQPLVEANPDPSADRHATDRFGAADVRFGSKCEILRLSPCFPLFPQKETSGGRAGMSEKCLRRPQVYRFPFASTLPDEDSSRPLAAAVVETRRPDRRLLTLGKRLRDLAGALDEQLHHRSDRPVS